MVYKNAIHMHDVSAVKIDNVETKFDSHGEAYYVKTITITQDGADMIITMFSKDGDIFGF